jgi:UDP-sugar pyrophosphorylase
MTSTTSYLQLYIEYILAVQKKYAPAGAKLPLCIMTSGDTNARTIELLQKHHYFGMHKDQVTIVQQGKGVPAIMDNDARLALESPYVVQTKPHGHGDIHELLHAHNVVHKWKRAGIHWLTLFQDTNGLAFHTLPLMLGVSSKLDLLMNSLTIPRKAKQAVGGIVKLKDEKTGEVRCV